MQDTIKQFLSSMTLERLIPAIIILIVGIIVIRILLKLFVRGLQKSKLERGMHTFLKQVMRILLYFILILIVAESLGINTTSLVALLSVVSLAFSLAVQNSLSNVVGGITVLTTHPFHTGDFVEVNGEAGTVDAISMTYTVLITPDNKRVYIPNSDTAAAKVINYSAQGTRRVDLTVSASYNCAPQAVMQALRAAADSVSCKLETPGVETYVSEYGESCIQYILRYWATAADYWTAYFTGLEAVKTAFDQNGIEMSYPHLNVHLDKGE